MERELPADAAVLGVDEHTAVLIDLRAEDIEIHGRGGVTIRRSGNSVVLPSGTRLSVADLRDLVRGIRRAREGAGGRDEHGGPARGDAGPGGGRLTADGNANRRPSGRPSGRHCRCPRSWRRPSRASGRPRGHGTPRRWSG